MKKTIAAAFLSVLISVFGIIPSANGQPALRALVVVAHPDDESNLSVTIYKIVKEHKGEVDIFVITNGEAGYRYSTLAEQYYGYSLTNAIDGKARLPRIRKKELREAGHILGISNYYFANEKDSHYSIDEHEPLDTSWHVPTVQRKLGRLLSKKNYDVVFCLLPEASAHAGHKAATILALNAVAKLPASRRPVVLGTALRNKTDSVRRYNGLAGYNDTRTTSEVPAFSTDRTITFSYKNRINYKIIANWELAAHKTQGATQMTMNDGDLEEFWYFAEIGPIHTDKVAKLFGLLNQSPYTDKLAVK